MYKTSRLGAFTLIELLIAMGILGTLAGFILFTYPASQRRARDTRRRSEIKQYQIALETYASRSPESLFPTPSGNLANLCTDLGVPVCPDNFGGLGSYQYQTNLSAIRYVIWAELEQPDDSGSTQYFVSCSSGPSGDTSIGIPPLGANCPF
jgi:prepilin-type N-terminal cleavage/methylation domain-containing protein